MPVRRLFDLPARLAELYFRLARRSATCAGAPAARRRAPRTPQRRPLPARAPARRRCRPEIRPPTPASFGSFDRPATQPHAATRLSRTSASHRSAPSPSTRGGADRMKRSERRCHTGHRYAGQRAAVGEKSSNQHLGAGVRSVAIAVERAAEALGIVMRQPVNQDRASAGRQGDFGRASDISAGKQHQRIGHHRQESVLADIDAGVLRDAARMRPVHDRQCLGGHVRRGVRIGDNRQRHPIAAVKAAGRRILQIKRRDLRMGLSLHRRSASRGRVGQALPGEHCPPTATAKMQRSFHRAGIHGQHRAVPRDARRCPAKRAVFRISETKRPGSRHRPRQAMPSPVRALVARIGRPLAHCARFARRWRQVDADETAPGRSC